MTRVFTCAECGDRLPDKEFRGKNNRRVEACRRCRRNARERSRYHKAQAEADQRLANIAKKEMTKVLKDSNASKLIREVRRLAAQDKYLARKYKAMLENGTETARTADALGKRQQKIELYKIVEELIMENEKRRVFHPLNYYLTNTKLLAAMGFPVTIRRGDPDLLRELHHDTREKGQERDRQDPKRT